MNYHRFKELTDNAKKHLQNKYESRGQNISSAISELKMIRKEYVQEYLWEGVQEVISACTPENGGSLRTFISNMTEKQIQEIEKRIQSL